MFTQPHQTVPALEICERARLSRDARFDGLFYTAVHTTGIYCRPTCPAPAPKPSNVSYYASPAAAEGAGYRPCLRCRPELSPSDNRLCRGDTVVERSLYLIEQGSLSDASMQEFASQLALSERQLRRLFIERTGVTPNAFHHTQRLLFSKQLLTETQLPITSIALASGFKSLRRFNAAFKDAYHMAPTALRKAKAEKIQNTPSISLRLCYRPPYDFQAMLEFLKGRALPGIESIDDISYSRVISGLSHTDQAGWIRVSQWPNEHALQLDIDPALSLQAFQIARRVRRMFDLDANPVTIAHQFQHDSRLKALVNKRPGLRLPSAWNGFEVAVRAILGQQVSVAAARTLAARIVQHYGTPIVLQDQSDLTHLFPEPDVLKDADLMQLGVIRARANTIQTMCNALLNGDIDFHQGQALETFVERWTALPGIGPWTAHYIAMRALGHPDAFPAEDLVLQKQIAPDCERMTTKQLRQRAEQWQPWRAYAVIHLWRDAALSNQSKAVKK